MALKIALILTFCVNFGGRLIYSLYGWDKAYFLGDALSWMIIGWYIIIKNTKPYITDKWEVEFAKNIGILIVSNFLDEAFFDPTVFGLNECILLLIVTLSSLNTWIKGLKHDT